MFGAAGNVTIPSLRHHRIIISAKSLTGVLFRREFHCANCGKRFKRKDKLKEHMTKIHHSQTVNSEQAMQNSQAKKFVPKVGRTFWEKLYISYPPMLDALRTIVWSTGESERLQSFHFQMPSMPGGFQAKGNAGESSGEAASRRSAGIRTGTELAHPAANPRLLLPVLRQGICIQCHHGIKKPTSYFRVELKKSLRAHDVQCTLMYIVYYRFTRVAASVRRIS